MGRPLALVCPLHLTACRHSRWRMVGVHPSGRTHLQAPSLDHNHDSLPPTAPVTRTLGSAGSDSPRDNSAVPAPVLCPGADVARCHSLPKRRRACAWQGRPQRQTPLCAVRPVHVGRTRPLARAQGGAPLDTLGPTPAPRPDCRCYHLRPGLALADSSACVPCFTPPLRAARSAPARLTYCRRLTGPQAPCRAAVLGRGGCRRGGGRGLRRRTGLLRSRSGGYRGCPGTRG